MIREPDLASEVVAAPTDNLAGVRSAMDQFTRINPAEWVIDYERGTDTLTLRRGSDVRAIAYFIPRRPEVMFLLDATSGELVGVDLERFKAVIAPDFPILRQAFSFWTAAKTLLKAPFGFGRRAGKTIADALEAKTSTEVVAATQRLCVVR